MTNQRTTPLKGGNRGGNWFRVDGNLTLRQKRFADEYIRTGSATQASRLAYNCKNARHQGYQALKVPEIKFYIESRVNDLKDHLYDLATTAKSENVQLAATIDALDRCLGKAKSTTEVTGANGGPISIQSMSLIYQRALKTDGGDDNNNGSEAGANGGGAVSFNN